MLGLFRFVEKFLFLIFLNLSVELYSFASDDKECLETFDLSQTRIDDVNLILNEKFTRRFKQKNEPRSLPNVNRKKQDKILEIQARNDIPKMLLALASAGDPEFTVDSPIYKFFLWQLNFFQDLLMEYGEETIDANSNPPLFLEYVYSIADDYIDFSNLEIRRQTHPLVIYIEASKSESFRPKFLTHSHDLLEYLKDRFSKFEIHEISLHLGNIFESRNSNLTEQNYPTPWDSMNRIEEKLYEILKYKEETQLLLNIYFSRNEITRNKVSSLSTREKFNLWLRSDAFKNFLTPENFTIEKYDLKNLPDRNIFIGFNLASLASFPELRTKVKEIAMHHIDNVEDAAEYKIILEYIDFLDSIESSRDIYSFSRNIDFHSNNHKWMLHAFSTHLRNSPLPEDILKENRDRVFTEYKQEEEGKYLNLWVSTVFFSPRNFHYRLLDALEHPSPNIRQFTRIFITETVEDIEQLTIPDRTKIYLGTFTNFPETDRFYNNFEYIVGRLPILDLLSILKENKNINTSGRKRILEIAAKIIPTIGIQRLNNNTAIHKKSIDEEFEDIHLEILQELLIDKSSPEEISVGLLMLFFAKKIPYRFSSKIPKLILASSPKFRNLIKRLYSDPSVTERYLDSFIAELRLGNLKFDLNTFHSQIHWHQEMLSFKQDSNHFKYSLCRNLLILTQMYDRAEFQNENIPEQVVQLLDQFDLWQIFKVSFKALSVETQQRFAFYFSLFVQMSAKAQKEGLRHTTTKATVLQAQKDNHPWAFKAKIREADKKTDSNSSAPRRSTVTPVYEKVSDVGEPALKQEEPTFDDYLERGDFEKVKEFLEKDSKFARVLSYDQISQILSFTKFKEFIEDVNIKSQTLFDVNTQNLIETFLVEIPDKHLDSILNEKKIHLLRFLTYAQHLKLKKSQQAISKTVQLHKSLSTLLSLLQYPQDRIRNYSYDILKNFVLDVDYQIPDILFEYFSSHFLHFILRNPSYSKTELLFLSKWFLKSSNEQQETLLSQILLQLGASRSNADMEHMIDFIQSTKTSLDHLRKNKSADYHVLEPWVLLYVLEAGFKLSRISMNMNYTQEENAPVLQEAKTGSSYFAKVLIDHLTFIKANPLTTLVDFEHAKKTHTIQSSWKPEVFASKALEFANSSMQDRNASRRTGEKAFFDPRGEMEKSAMFECINFEWMHGRFVWVVDDQHSLGYDILSYDPKRKYFYKIEVKAKFSDGYQLSLTSNELEKADISKGQKHEGYYVYLVDMDSLSNPNNKARVLFRYTGMTTDKIKNVSEYKPNEKVFLVPKIELAKFLMNTTD